MYTSPFIAQAAATLLVLIGTGPALLAQNGAIRLSLRGGWNSASEPVRKVQVVSPYAYLVVGESGLQVLNVTSPINPVPLGRYDAAHRINGFHVDGHHAYLATGDSITDTNDPGVLEVLDVGHPTNLVFLSETETQHQPNSVYVTNGFAYLAEGTWLSESNQVGAFEIFSVLNPGAPAVIGRYDASSPVNDIKVVDGYAYLAGGDADLTVLDVSNPVRPMWIGSFATNHFDPVTAVRVGGDHAYVWVAPFGIGYIVDITNPAVPRWVADLGGSLSGAEFGTHTLTVSDRYLCLLWGFRNSNGSLTVVLKVADIRNPDHAPWGEHLASLDLCYSCQPLSISDLELVGNYLYAATSGHGLQVFEIVELPYFTSISRRAGNILLTWNELPDLKLQSTPSLVNPNWTDVPGSLGTNRIELPLSTGPEFFRLIQTQNAP